MSIACQAYRGFAADGADVVETWNAAMGDAFPLDERLWRQNVDDDPNHDPDGLIVARERGQCLGFVRARVARVALGRVPSPADRGWIGAVAVHPAAQRRGIGRALLQRAETWLRSKGVREVRVGGDPGHFFPGIPESQEAAVRFFTEQGYEPLGERCWDLKSDIRDFRVPALVDRIAARHPHFRVAQATTRTVPALLDFLATSFPGRWLYETQLRLETERSPQEIELLLIGQRVMGFAHTFTTRSRRLGPSVYWRGLLGRGYGGLGPMGVAEELRNTGMGYVLLCESVERLRNAGVAHTVVDWTVLTRFYGAAGFEPWKAYQPYQRAL